MKNLFVLVCLLVSICFRALSQEYIEIGEVKTNLYYLYIFQEDSTNRNSVKSQEMILQIGDNFSKFTSVNKLFRDSLLMVYKDEDPGAAAGKIIPQVMGASIHNFCNYDIYKNYPEKQVTNTISYLNKKHLKVRESLSFDWKILPGKDSLILGLPCKLAATSFAGREYFAWFTPEIPISDGPYKFSGLPGLIVSVSDVEKQHRFELMSIQIPKHKPQTFYVKNDFIEVTPADYLKAIHLKTSQLYNRIQQEDGITPKNDESKANALNNLKARNNFIEKY